MEATLKAIGHLETPYTDLAACPRNVVAGGALCKVVLAEEFREGLLGLEVGRKIVLLYWFAGVERGQLRRHSRKSGVYSGVFALRTPHRPNPIGLAEVVIEKIEGAILYVRGLDCLNGTPLLDIKPAMAAEKEKGEESGRD